MQRMLFGAVALAAAASAPAQEVTGYAGTLRVNEANEHTFTAGASYTHPVHEYLALSVSYLNEGHPIDHHRDGVAGQVWVRSGPNQPGWSVAAGAGQYFYFDTSQLHSDSSTKYTNDHGWAAIYSLQATYHYADSRWYNQVQINRISPSGKDSTTSLMLGVGYQFNGVKGDKLHLEGPTTDEAITLMAGQGINNSLSSETAAIAGLEYRRAVGRYVDWTVTALYEGNTPQSKRNGVATQLWLIRSLNQKVELGMGAGPYFNAKVPDAEGQRSHKAGLISIGGRYHLAKRVVAQATWNRVVTDYHRDADLFLIGLGYSF
ncbi:hypothetical protein [Duganella margarita]|uniref:hypothetical protein n=1 Tax=Duganella margarita TaxID=2692170 RepID=UPI001E4671E7|nr:hypothetical protein [Duganella margarita]